MAKKYINSCLLITSDYTSYYLSNSSGKYFTRQNALFHREILAIFMGSHTDFTQCYKFFTKSKYMDSHVDFKYLNWPTYFGL